MKSFLRTAGLYSIAIVLFLGMIFAMASPIITKPKFISGETGTFIQKYSDCRGKSDKMVEFVLQCAKNANPMSDEEGEDLVAECVTSSRKLYCPLKTREVKKEWSRCWIGESETVPCSYGGGGSAHPLVIEVD